MTWGTVGREHEGFWRGATSEALALPSETVQLSFMVRGGGLLFPTRMHKALREHMERVHNTSLDAYTAAKFAGKLNKNGKRQIYSEYEVMGAFLYYIDGGKRGGNGGGGGGGGSDGSSSEYPYRDTSRDSRVGVPKPSHLAWNIAHERYGVAKWPFDSPNFPIMQSWTWGHGGLGDEGRLVYECILGGGIVGPPDPPTGTVHKNHSTECDIHILAWGAGLGRGEKPRCPWTWGRQQGGCSLKDAF